MTIQASTRITRAPSDGQPGADAVSYRLQPLPDAAHYTDGQYSPASISVSAYKRVGAAAEQLIALSPTTCEIGYQLIYADGSAAAMAWISDTTAGTIALADNADGSQLVRVDLRLYEHLADGSSAAVARTSVPVVKTGVNGKDGISIVVSPQTVFFTKGKAAFAYVAVDLYDGGVLINQSKVGFSNLTTPATADLVDGVLVWNGNLTDSGTRFRYQLAYGGNGDIDITVPFTVTYNGTAYNLSFSVKTVADGQSTYLSTVFRGYTPTTAAPTPSKPTGGSYAGTSSATAGLPEDGLWTDGIPDTDEPLWTSQRRFTSDGLSPQDAEWSDPILLADTPDFDVEYSDSIEQPEAPNGHPCTNTVDNGGPWTSTPSSSAVWMATSYRRNGKWSTWAVTRIKGENGTSIAVKGAAKAHYATHADRTANTVIHPIGSLLLVDQSQSDSTAGPYVCTVTKPATMVTEELVNQALATVGDGYICAADGHLWMAADDGWQDCGQIKGDPGQPGPPGESIEGPRGYQGIIIRTTEWQEGKVYRNDDGFVLDSNNQPTEEVRSEEGTGRRYLDIVFISSDNSDDYAAYVYTYAKPTTATAANKPGSGSEWATYWEQISSLTPIMTPLVVARLALVSYLQANTITADEIYMVDENDNVLFRAQNGEVVCNTGTFRDITVNSGTFNNITVNQGIFNAITVGSGAKIGWIVIDEDDLVGVDSSRVERLRITPGTLPPISSANTTTYPEIVSIGSTPSDANREGPTTGHLYGTDTEVPNAAFSVTFPNAFFDYDQASAGVTQADRLEAIITLADTPPAYSTIDLRAIGYSAALKTNSGTAISGTDITLNCVAYIEQQDSKKQWATVATVQLSQGQYSAMISTAATTRIRIVLTATCYAHSIWKGTLYIGVDSSGQSDVIAIKTAKEQTFIASDGIMSVYNSNYMRYSKNDGFAVKVGNYGLRVTSSGIQKTTNGGSSWTSL